MAQHMLPRHAGWVLVGRLGCHDRGSRELSEIARAVREALGDFNCFGDPSFFGVSDCCRARAFRLESYRVRDQLSTMPAAMQEQAFFRC